MTQDTPFKEQFYSLCEMLGESESTLNATYGKAADISADEHRAFVCYPDSHAVFRIKNKVVDHLSIPLADAYGHAYEGAKDFYSLDGVKLGMTIEEIIAEWGEPVSRKYINYENKKTKSGKSFTIGFRFDEDENSVKRLTQFAAYPYVVPTFEKVFTELCELLGCNEETIIDNIGKPDSTKTNEYGTKFIYYERYKATFTLDSTLHTASYVSSPNSGIDGKALSTTDSYYTIKGLKIGDSRITIQNNWGRPSSEAVYNWGYINKGGKTKSRNQYELRIVFKMDNPENLAEFEGGLIEETEQYIEQASPKPKSGCFVATVCYGNYEAKEVLILRKYRDKVLMKSRLGKISVQAYYLISPPLAKLIDKSSTIKTFIRRNILDKIVSKIQQKRNL